MRAPNRREMVEWPACVGHGQEPSPNKVYPSDRHFSCGMEDGLGKRGCGAGPQWKERGREEATAASSTAQAPSVTRHHGKMEECF